MTTRNAIFGGFCLVSAVLLTASAVQSQTNTFNIIESSQTATPAAVTSSKTSFKSSKPGAQPEKPAGKKSSPKGSKKTDDASPKTAKRSTTPTVPPDPEELKLRPDQDGLLQFNFRGQPWPELLK